jgi:hypothetical protein
MGVGQGGGLPLSHSILLLLHSTLLGDDLLGLGLCVEAALVVVGGRGVAAEKPARGGEGEQGGIRSWGYKQREEIGRGIEGAQGG